MQIVNKRRPLEIAYGFFLLSHPAPVLLHTIGVTIFTLLAAWTLPQPTWSTILLVIGAHTAMQISIAMLNDYCDQHADATAKPKKPIPRGLIHPREALLVGLLMIAIMLLLLLPLPRPALLISLAYLALGQGYNLGLKATPFSGIVFALAIPLIPLYAFAGVGRTLPVLFWLVPVGMLLGITLNVANSIPDIEEDAATGTQTLAVALGVKRSFLVCRFLIVAGALLMGILTAVRIVPARPLIIVLVLIFTGLAVGSMFLFFGPGKPVPTRKVHFYVTTLTCIVLAGGWLIGVLI
jgi:4-hydroxybenzoate polyprenyltransferase